MAIVDYDILAGMTGPPFRKSRRGPELELIERFLNRPHFQVPQGCEALVFREPRIASGFPDLVVVIWDRAKAAGWKTARKDLLPEDLRLAHYLYHVGQATEDALKAIFPQSARKSIARLSEGGLLKKETATWSLRNLKTVFAAQEIIAIEAKVSEWKSGLEQAVLNTWFASASYILVPELPERSSLPQRARALGVGIWIGESVSVKARRAQPLPRSYASWLFNEWAWRATARIG